MPKITGPLDATLVPLSQSTELLVVEKRTALIIRGKEAFRLSWDEWRRLAAFAAASLEPPKDAPEP
jgi:hypothetical protein